MSLLKNKTALITGASRGIGRAIALRLAEEGAAIAVLAKTDTPHPKLPGTIHTVCQEIEKRGAKALPLKADIRFEDQIEEAAFKAVETFGSIDILVNNASAIFPRPTLETPMKRFDLMFDCNVRGTFACCRACLPHLIKGKNPHILNLSPPLKMDPKWFKDMLAYTMSKYGMSMCTLGMSAEFAEEGVAVNSLWPKTTIATSAIRTFFPDMIPHSRKEEIVADAALAILAKDSRTCTGNFFIDEDVLKNEGVTDFELYSVEPGAELQKDFYI